MNDFKNLDYIMRNGILIGCHQGLDLKQFGLYIKITKFIKNYN